MNRCLKVIVPALLCIGLTLPASSAVASPGAGASCTAGSATQSTTFASTGAEQCYTIPQGVNELVVTAIGGQGSGGTEFGSEGGRGAQVTGDLNVSDLDLKSANTLFVGSPVVLVVTRRGRSWSEQVFRG